MQFLGEFLTAHRRLESSEMRAGGGENQHDGRFQIPIDPHAPKELSL
jgi:hypothetical protein